MERWGRIDVIVHNARYIGPGHMDRFLDTPIALLDAHLQANVLATLVLNQLLLPKMIENGGGTVVNITSASGYADPTEPAGEGGWGMGYGISKGAMQRIAGFLAVELRDQGVQAFNVQPGFVATERIAQDMASSGSTPAGKPASVISAVVALAASDRRRHQRHDHRGAVLRPRAPARARGGPVPGQSIRYDMAAANIAALEERYAAESSSSGRESSAEIRARLPHPVVDGDGHIMEYFPRSRGTCARRGSIPRAPGCAAGAGLFEPGTRRRVARLTNGCAAVPRPPWWGSPARTRDLATALHPELLRTSAAGARLRLRRVPERRPRAHAPHRRRRASRQAARQPVPRRGVRRARRPALRGGGDPDAHAR